MIFADTWKEDFSSFLKNGALYICLGIIVLIIATIIVIYVIKNRKKKIAEPQYNENFNLWIEKLGGKDNIVSVSGIGSRLSLELKDDSLLKEDIKELGVTSIMKMSGKIVLVVENSASDIAEKIQNNIK